MLHQNQICSSTVQPKNMKKQRKHLDGPQISHLENGVLENTQQVMHLISNKHLKLNEK